MNIDVGRDYRTISDSRKRSKGSAKDAPLEDRACHPA
jgi:hypothetical protein